MKFLSFLFLSIGCIALAAQSKIAINQATLAAPEAFRAEATVYLYDEDGTISLARKGTNGIICLGDDPNKEGFSVAAYSEELQPFMERGRALRAEGLTYQEIFDQREAEVRSGALEMPDKSTLYVLTGEFDDDNSPTNTHLRYVFYIPFATSESTGLPTSPASPGGPWIMDPGTHRAHIMITPPRKD
ncbi:hypothetical protein [Marinoscillum furvescens]|uniref:Uncharacterized protein n=1 Tax=Marinoscillum furvescens DSM 4134 TaxID=1122208 RepID=A0A3D9KW39_MARFU|nr:hypothetical protein [Marinoscillum furvescens]RED92060.1 hypothetical protein C7460_13329 [Marinoscillum furvescens DSM 4134]